LEEFSFKDNLCTQDPFRWQASQPPYTHNCVPQKLEKRTQTYLRTINSIIEYWVVPEVPFT